MRDEKGGAPRRQIRVSMTEMQNSEEIMHDTALPSSVEARRRGALAAVAAFALYAALAAMWLSWQ